MEVEVEVVGGDLVAGFVLWFSALFLWCSICSLCPVPLFCLAATGWPGAWIIDQDVAIHKVFGASNAAMLLGHLRASKISSPLFLQKYRLLIAMVYLDEISFKCPSVQQMQGGSLGTWVSGSSGATSELKKLSVLSRHIFPTLLAEIQWFMLSPKLQTLQ